jgi:ribosomal protein L18E
MTIQDKIIAKIKEVSNRDRQEIKIEKIEAVNYKEKKLIILVCSYQ